MCVEGGAVRDRVGGSLISYSKREGTSHEQLCVCLNAT